MEVELEHAIAYTCTEDNSLHYHPNGREYISVTGHNISKFINEIKRIK